MGSKRAATIVSAILIVFVSTAVIFYAVSRLGKKPFADLSAKDIMSFDLLVEPPFIKAQFSDTETIGKLASILTKVKTYSQDNTMYYGQSCLFTLRMKSGEIIISVQAGNPIIAINGIGYKTLCEPCEELNGLANALISPIPKITLHSSDEQGYLYALSINSEGQIVLAPSVLIGVRRGSGFAKGEFTVYWAKEGSNEENILMSGSQVSTELTDNVWQVSVQFPNGFAGRIWAEASDSDGTVYRSESLNVVYAP